MLYRAASYAREAPREEALPPRLNVEELSHIEYDEWEEQGPMLEVRGRLIAKSGEAVPCRLVILWRLMEPKILGRYP
jgi:hypothetical protein